MTLIVSSIFAFLQSGGFALYAIAFCAFVLWFLVLLQLLFLLIDRKNMLANIHAKADRFMRSPTCDSYHFRNFLISKASWHFRGNLLLMKTIVVIAPLLGLLGTVSGMIEVFEVLGFVGTGDAKLMSAGVAKATIPTMAGMVLAILGIFFLSQFEAVAKREIFALQKRLKPLSDQSFLCDQDAKKSKQ